MEQTNEIHNELTSGLDSGNGKINIELPIKWLKFFTYIRIPFGIAVTLIQAFTSMNLLVITINLLYCSFGGLVAFGLHKRRLWGWRLVLTLVVIESFLLALRSFEILMNIFTYFGFLVVIFVVWGLPNIIYFKKRKYMFN